LPDTNTGATDRLGAVLAERYGLETCQLTQLPIGQGTVNYRADCADREVFVKNYPRHADLPGERAAIGLSALAGRHGIPVADVLPSRDGEVIDTSAGIAVSVWEWMPGRVITGNLTTAQHERAGASLGYSTVTDLARLRGWSTSCPFAVASSQAKTCSGTVATRGCSSVGTAGIWISVSA
jgi:Ser/Thr protein kinase RdoA (MazF antagonist)